MAKNKNRDEFTERTKLQIAKQAGWLCSDPACRNPTVGATINIGTAAHICAAAPGGPRYDPKMSSEERRSAKNGIWMCRDHGKAVDSDDPEFTVERLREWKRQAEQDARRRVLRHEALQGPVAASDTELAVRLRAAAVADLEVFRRTAKWPSTPVALTLSIDGDPMTTSAAAHAATSLGDLILVAPPGMGKTTTLFQIAEGILASGSGTPLFVPLGDWGTETTSLLESIRKRPAFRGVSEDDFRAVAAKPGVVLLLDGWNELDASARRRAIAQVEVLKAELPELSFVISTRKQDFGVPIAGTRIELLPLDDRQQMEIAVAMRGDSGARIVDRAWRTAGVRELVTIPLYLTALLTLQEGAPFPATKEEVLRRFVFAHEEDTRHAEALRAVVDGLQQDYLDGLAILATRTANTSINDSNARRSISDTQNALFANGQITIKSQSGTVLDVLVSNHVLMRAGDTPGYSFQHQQFQEWYASHTVERLMMAAVGDVATRGRLKAEILDQRPWEEAILFAVERLARGDGAQQRACSAAILAAFAVDPILAAEMIFRSTDPVWEQISADIQTPVRTWHTPGKVDRALRFMITSGRPEFLDLIWPLITHEKVHLSALRAGTQFPASLLGRDASKRIAALSPQVRARMLHEIASSGGIDGLDLATAIAKADRDPEVKASVINALAFRRADRHVVEVLGTADDKTFDLVAGEGLIDDISDQTVQQGLKAARDRQRKASASYYDGLRSIIYAKSDEGHGQEVSAIVAEMDIDRKREDDRRLLYEVHQRYPRALAEGLLRRVREGRTLFYGTDDMLGSADFALEDDELLSIALAEARLHDDRAEAAASVLGPRAVGRMIDAYLEARKGVRDANGNYDKAASDRYHDLRTRIEHTPAASLLAAVQARAAKADYEEIAELAGLLCSRPEAGHGRGRPFSAEAPNAIGALALKWGERMLAAGDEANRSQIASLARLISYAPSPALLPLLKRLLDYELRRHKAFREEAKASGWRPGKARNEATWYHTNEYKNAFLAIKAPETAALMEVYLADELFGESAAQVLAAQWMEANEPKDDNTFQRGVDFSRVEERRAARAAHPADTSEEAEAIFHIIDSLIADESTDEQKKLAVDLAIVAARLPHGQRVDTIRKLIALAPRRSRAALLLSLVLSGETIDIEVVEAGIGEVFEAAKKENWILTQGNGYELREWLRLLPFVNRPADALAIVRGMPGQQRDPRFLEEMVGAFVDAPSDEAEEVMFKLAEEDPRLYANHRWREAVLRRGTLSSAQRFIDLAAQGLFDDKSADDWHLAQQIGGLMEEHVELRTHVYDLLKEGAKSHGLILLARAVAEKPDADGLLLLLKLQVEQKRSFVDWPTIQRVVTEEVPVENWKGAYNIMPVPAVALRKKLLAMTTSGGVDDHAARCLNLIDRMRDDYGTPESEPRHPDLASGRPWPIIAPDPDAEDAG